MLITDIAVNDLSNTADARGHVAITTDSGTCHFDCHAMGQGSAPPSVRHDMLVRAALDQMQRMPIHRRTRFTLRLNDPLAA